MTRTILPEKRLNMVPLSCLSVVFFPDLRVRIRHLNVELRCPQDDLLPLDRTHVVCYLSAVLPVVHHQQVQLVHVAHHIFVEPVRKKIASFLVRTITDLKGRGWGIRER